MTLGWHHKCYVGQFAWMVGRNQMSIVDEVSVPGVRRLGYRISLVGAALAIGYITALAFAIMTGGLPLQEPLESLIALIVLGAAPALVLLASTVHLAVSPERHGATLPGLAFMVIFAVLTSVNRYVQLTVVRQSDAGAEIDLIRPYAWPSVMAAIEILGWGLFLGLSLLCLAEAFRKSQGERMLSGTLAVSGLLCLGPFAALLTGFLPLMTLGVIAWGPGLALICVLLARWFARPARLPSNLTRRDVDEGCRIRTAVPAAPRHSRIASGPRRVPARRRADDGDARRLPAEHPSSGAISTARTCD